MTKRGNVSPPDLFVRFSGVGNNPWEIGRPQAAIVQLVRQGIFHGKVLDIGCGIGDNAIYIARHGNNVRLTGIDLLPRSIEIAYQRATRNRANIRFGVVNMLEDLSKTNLNPYSYDIILDSAIFHIFSNEDRQRYIKNVEYLIKPGGLYIQLCFSEKETREGGPRRVNKSHLYQLFSPRNGWTIESIEDSIYQLIPGILFDTDARAYLSLIRRNNTLF